MNLNSGNRRNSILLWIVILAYSIWTAILAITNGVMKWGALGNYSLFPYVLLLGLICCALVFLMSKGNEIKGTFLLLYLGYGHVLGIMKPIQHINLELGWVFDFIGYVTAFTVIATGIVFTQNRRSSY